MVHYQLVNIFSVLIKLQRWEKSQQSVWSIISCPVWDRSSNRGSPMASVLTKTIGWRVLTWCETWGNSLKMLSWVFVSFWAYTAVQLLQKAEDFNCWNKLQKDVLLCMWGITSKLCLHLIATSEIIAWHTLIMIKCLSRSERLINKIFIFKALEKISICFGFLAGSLCGFFVVGGFSF